MRIQLALLMILLISCQNKQGKEIKLNNNDTINPVVVNQCPDSAITYDSFRKYSSSELSLDENILNSINSKNKFLSDILDLSIKTENLKNKLSVFELYKRQKDSSNVLVLKNVAKLVKGESPYSQEYYVYKEDTLFASSENPIYYYYDDSLKMVEEYHFEKVEGCSFGKQIKYYKNDNPILIRGYDFSDNCWPKGENDKVVARFQDSYKFIKGDRIYAFQNNIEFFNCIFSESEKKYVFKSLLKTSIDENFEKGYIEIRKIE